MDLHGLELVVQLFYGGQRPGQHLNARFATPPSPARMGLQVAMATLGPCRLVVSYQRLCAIFFVGPQHAVLMSASAGEGWKLHC